MFSKEVFVLPRPLKRDPELGLCWASPTPYAVGMSGLGYQLVFSLLDKDEQVSVLRAFTDYQEPGWQDCELIGFTLAFELNYVNVLTLLSKMGVSPLSRDRAAGAPLVFGGGPALAANPEPFADFFDVILLGDAEELIPCFLAKWKEVRLLKDRQTQLVELATVEGLYVPSLYSAHYACKQGPLTAVVPEVPGVPARVHRRQFMGPPDYVAHTTVLAPESSWADMFLVEVVRSCPQECRFCLSSYLARPFRGADVETLLSKIDLGLKYTSKIGLLGPSVTEHKQFALIAEELIKRPTAKISVASLRADSIDPLVLSMLVKLGQKTVTIALESGSERLRTIMKKNLSESEILTAMDLIAASGLSGVKLYGIVGLPGETQDDLDETIKLLCLLKKKHRHLRLTFGVSSFVPKAQTPFQWSGRDRHCQQKLSYIRKHLSRVGIDVRAESHNWSDVQALLSRGDRRLTEVLLGVASSAGNLGAWRNSLRNLPPGCPPEDYYVFRNIPYSETLPWQHLMDEDKALMLTRHSQQAQRLFLPEHMSS